MYQIQTPKRFGFGACLLNNDFTCSNAEYLSWCDWPVLTNVCKHIVENIGQSLSFGDIRSVWRVSLILIIKWINNNSIPLEKILVYSWRLILHSETYNMIQ